MSDTDMRRTLMSKRTTQLYLIGIAQGIILGFILGWYGVQVL